MANPQREITPKKETQDGRKKTLPNKARRKRIRRAEYVTDGKEGNQYRKGIYYGIKKDVT